MPIYGFQCPECGQVKEKIESYKESEMDHNCSNCSVKMDKLLNTASMTFNCSGQTPRFYPKG